MNYKLNYMCLKRGVSLILGHGVYNQITSDVWSRDLRIFEIRFEFESDVPIRIRIESPIRIRIESDVPIRKFRIGRTCRVSSYHKLRSLTVQQKTSIFTPFVVEIYVYNSILRVAVLL